MACAQSPVPALATSAWKRGSMAGGIPMPAGGLQSSSSSINPRSPSPVALRMSSPSPSDEQRMLPGPRLRVPSSDTEVPTQRKERDGKHLALPVDAIVNAAVPGQRSSPFRRLSHFKRSLLLSGATLSLTTTVLLVLTWKLLQEPLGDDLARNVSHMALLILPADGAIRRGVTRVDGSHEADNETAMLDEATASPPSAGGVRPLF